MDATLSRLASIRASKQPSVAVNDWLGVEEYYKSRSYLIRKAAEALTAARILRDCAEHHRRPPGANTAANLTTAANYRRQAMEMTHARD